MIDLKNKVFLDSDGEMTFENKERLNFIMHFMKQGAVEQVATNKDGTFVREDAEISFNEIWLPCAESKQAEIEVLKTKLAKAQAVPNVQQALNDRLLVRSIKEKVESHIAEISVNDLFDKGWFAAMKCIQSNIDRLKAREPAND